MQDIQYANANIINYLFAEIINKLKSLKCVVQLRQVESNGEAFINELGLHKMRRIKIVI